MVAELKRRIINRFNALIPANNESVYLNTPVPISFSGNERSSVTQAVMDTIVNQRVQIRHCVVVKVEPADLSAAAVLVTVRKAPV